MLVVWQPQTQTTLATGATYRCYPEQYMDVDKYGQIIAELVTRALAAGAKLEFHLETALTATEMEAPGGGRSGWADCGNSPAVLDNSGGGTPLPFVGDVIANRVDGNPPQRRMIRWAIKNIGAAAATFDFNVLVDVRDPDCSCGR